MHQIDICILNKDLYSLNKNHFSNPRSTPIICLLPLTPEKPYHRSRNIRGVDLLGVQLPSAICDGLGPFDRGRWSGRGAGLLVAQFSQEALATGGSGQLDLLRSDSLTLILLVLLWFCWGNMLTIVKVRGEIKSETSDQKLN